MDDFDPFSLRPMRLFGLDIIEAKQRPRYEMPEWLVPGVVRWDAKTRNEVNAWSREFLGMVDVIPRGTAYLMANRFAVMHPADVVKLTNIC